MMKPPDRLTRERRRGSKCRISAGMAVTAQCRFCFDNLHLGCFSQSRAAVHQLSLMWVSMLLYAALLAVSVAGQSAGIHSGSNGQVVTALDSCVDNPLQKNCSSFEYPLTAAAEDLNKLCSAMHFMSACSVAKACNASGAGPDNPTGPGAARVSSSNPDICQPFNQVVTVCKLDQGMGRMSGCANVNTMCVEGSKVPICSAQTGLSVLPTSELVNKQVRSICEEMTMDGCEKCMPSWQAGRTWADCDLLDVYSYLCYQMPEMGQCSDWHAMCKADSSLSFCHGTDGSGGSSGAGGATGGPVMKMYFFEELPFYLLFKNWTPRTSRELAGAWFAVFALGLLYEFLQMMYGRYETRFWARMNGRMGRTSQGLDLESGRPIAEGVEGLGQPLNGDSSGSTGRQPKTCCGGGGNSGSLAAPPDLVMSPSSAANGGFSSHKAAPATVRPNSCKSVSSCFASYFQPELVIMDVLRGLARFMLAGLAYLLMLAAMSYHVAIFFAVITGVGVGSMLFGRWRFVSGIAEGYSHCGCGSS